MNESDLQAKGFVLGPDGVWRKAKSISVRGGSEYPNGRNTEGMKEKVASPPAPVRIRQSKKPLMNKLELEWFSICKSTYPEHCTILAQAIRFRLGNGIWYKPDVLVFGHNIYAYEVKGPHAFRGGFENLKVAASLYQNIKWTLVWKENGEWKEQEVLP